MSDVTKVVTPTGCREHDDGISRNAERVKAQPVTGQRVIAFPVNLCFVNPRVTCVHGMALEVPCSRCVDIVNGDHEGQDAAVNAAMLAGFVAGVLQSAEGVDAAAAKHRGIARDALAGEAKGLRQYVAGDRAALDGKARATVRAFLGGAK